MPKKLIVHPKFQHLEDELQSAINSFASLNKNVLKRDRNVIKKITIQGIHLNFKKFKTPNPLQGFVYSFIRKSKAERSFEYAEKLRSLGINTPQPVAYFINTEGVLKESFYISEHIDYDFDFRVLIHNPKMKNRETILKQFTRFCFQLHENSVNFLDHSPGNTLIVENESGNYDFYLIDLNRMRFETMDFEARLKNFRRLWLSKTMVKIIAEEYAILSNKTFEETHKLLLRFSRNFQKAKNKKKLRRRKRASFKS